MSKLSPSTTLDEKQRKKKKLFRIGGWILAILIVFRLLLPGIILRIVNGSLSKLDGYYGHVEDIDLSLYRGAYVVDSIHIDVVDSSSQKHTLLFGAKSIDISVEWKSLFKGKIVSELYFYDPILRFTKDAAEPGQLDQDTSDFRKMLKTFTPISVNLFEVFGGKIQFVDHTSTPEVDLYLDNAHILARNLSNVEDTTLLPATIKAEANVYDGVLNFNMRINALASVPTFDLNAEVKNANLVKLNTFFQAYGDFDVNKGSIDVFFEVAAKDNKYIGYVKPVIKDLDVVGPEDRRDNVLRQIWESLVGIVGDILENPSTDQVAAKVPVVGVFGEQTIGIWYAILTTLRNGFIQALYPALDQQVSIGSVQSVNAKDEKKGGVFNKVFGSPTAKKDPPKNKKD